MESGILHQLAPELRVHTWIDGKGVSIPPLHLRDLGSSYRVLFCFQHWCPDSHRIGFPALRRLVDGLRGTPFRFAAVQTVFEGYEVNTVNRLNEAQRHYGLSIPFGHDFPSQGERYPSLMTDYQTCGTPWFIVIDPDGTVVHNNFTVDTESLIEILSGSQ